MRRSVGFSIGVHVAAILLALIGLPFLRQKPMELPPPVPVDVVSEVPTTTKIAEPKPVEKPTPEPPKPPPELKPMPVPQVAQVATPDPLPTPDLPELKKPPAAPPKDPLAPLKMPDLAKVETESETVNTPKLELKKKEPPKEQAPKKPEPSMDSVLKNLAKIQPQPEKSDQPPQKNAPPAKPQASALAQLADKLSAGEEDALRHQIQGCWNVPVGARDAQNLVIELDVQVNPDRTVRAVRVVDQGRMASDSFFRAAADSAVRALRNPACNPLALPPDKYAQWQQLTLRFNPKDLFGT